MSIADYRSGTRRLGVTRTGHVRGPHGSWNRKPFSGYKVIFVPFRQGRPSGPPVDVLTGFLRDDATAHGRPVGVDGDNGLLVADDVGNTIWRVTGPAGDSQAGNAAIRGHCYLEAPRGINRDR